MSRASRRDGEPGGPARPVCVPDETGHCGVCGDRGRVARVLELLDGERAARVRVEEPEPSGEVAEAALDLVDGVAPGDRIVVHMGFAIAVVRDGEGDGTTGRRGAGAPAEDPRPGDPSAGRAGERP